MLSMEDYQRSIMLSDRPFYALIAAAMRRADTDNSRKLQQAFPATHRLLQERYNNPGGFSDIEMDQQQGVTT